MNKICGGHQNLPASRYNIARDVRTERPFFPKKFGSTNTIMHRICTDMPNPKAINRVTTAPKRLRSDAGYFNLLMTVM